MEMLLWDFEGVVVGGASSTSKSTGVGVVENLTKKISIVYNGDLKFQLVWILNCQKEVGL